LPALPSIGTRKLRDALFAPAPFTKSRVSEDLTGLEFRPDGIALVRVRRPAGAAPNVTACEFRPAGSPEEFQRELQRLATQYDLKRARCSLVLEPGEYTIVSTEAPTVPQDELRAAVRWRVKDLIDFPIDDATLDVFFAPATPGQATRQLYVVAARNGAILRVADMCNQAGVNLDVIDVPELVQRNLATLCAADQEGLALIVFAADHGLVTVTRRGELYMSRRLEIGTDAMARADEPARYFEQVTLEVQRSLDYFDSHFRAAPVTHLVVALPAPVSGLMEFLGANLNLRVAELQLAERIDGSADIAALLQERCLGALGAALRVEDEA
jgi:MSHA biogenesis protein MshI